jgi:hypothetical protein
MVKTYALSGLECNSPQRVNQKSLVALKASIAKRGIITPVIVDRKTMTIIDGHRRLYCACALGITDIPVIFSDTDGPVTTLYSELNETARPFVGPDKLYAAATGGVKYSGITGLSIDRLIEIVGHSRAAELARNGKSSSLYNEAVRFGRYCGMCTSRGGVSAQDKEAISVIIEWALKHKMVNFARMAIKEGIPPAVLQNAIENDKPLVMKWG